ncbi:MAG: tetratricopeptide repeat protein [Desulfobacteraceae bacterium]|nr:tetratricopeptide repeat protein [Desulfobacteraceae bacterium]
MKKSLKLCFLLMMALFFLTACASGQKNVKKQQAEAIRNLGEAYMAQDAYTMALREFLKAESIYANDPYLQDDLGVAYMAKGSMDNAVAHFKKALKINPKYSPARNNLGSAYMEMEKWEEAIECFNLVKADLLYGTPHYPLTNLGFVYYKLKDYDQAVKNYQEAIDVAPNFPMAFHGLGLVYMAMGKNSDAVAALQSAVEKAPKEGPIYMDLGKAYQQSGEYNKAYDAFNKAAELAKDAKSKTEALDAAKKVWTH